MDQGKTCSAISDHGVENLPTEFQITALKIIMTTHLERFDTIERASRASVDAVQNIIDNIKDYATELRLRKIKPMSSGGFVDQVGYQERIEGEQEEWLEGTWKEENNEQDEWSWYMDQAIQGFYAMAKTHSRHFPKWQKVPNDQYECYTK